MSRYVLLDTNTLPKNFNGFIWRALFYCARRKNLVLALSEVVCHEAVNRQRRAALEAIDALTKAYASLVEQYPNLDGLYAPDPDEVAAYYRELLSEHFQVIPVAGHNAIEALRREAMRIPPAREGSGARDSAIWLTACDLIRGGNTVDLITANSKDFGSGKLHDELAKEIPVEESLRYFPNLNNYLMDIAPILRDIDPPRDGSRFNQSIVGVVKSWILLHYEEISSGLSLGFEEILNCEFSASELEFNFPYNIDGYHAFPCRGRLNYQAAALSELSFSGWIVVDPSTGSVESCDVERVWPGNLRTLCTSSV